MTRRISSGRSGRVGRGSRAGDWGGAGEGEGEAGAEGGCSEQLGWGDKFFLISYKTFKGTLL